MDNVNQEIKSIKSLFYLLKWNLYLKDFISINKQNWIEYTLYQFEMFLNDWKYGCVPTDRITLESKKGPKL